MKGRAGFTLIEIMVVVGIIVIMLATAVMSVASGRGAVQVKEATRGVIQLSRYASALALLRQKPVVVTFSRKKDLSGDDEYSMVEVRISGESEESGGKGTPADPIYREVDGTTAITAAEVAEESQWDGDDGGAGKKGAASSAGGKDAKDPERNGLFFTRQVLDPEVLAKEDAEGRYEGVTFTVEVLGEDGKPLEPELAAARTLRQPKRIRKTEDGEPAEEGGDALDDVPPVSVTYEPNGTVNPHRIIVRLASESEAAEGFAINISRSGKATVGDDIEEEGVRRTNGRRRRR